MENKNSTLLLYHTGAFTVNCPKHIENLEQVLNQIENDKNYVQVNGNARARENHRANVKRQSFQN